MVQNLFYHYLKYLLLTIFLSVGFSLIASAQQKETGTISGIVKDNQGKLMPYATVVLLHSPDSSLVTGAICNKEGKFILKKVPLGSYRLSAELLGYAKEYSRTFTIDDSHLEIMLPEIDLLPSYKSLKAVTVKSHKAVIVQKPGMLEVNVENSIISSGSNVLEMLQKLPGITIDQDGNVSLKGKSGVQMLINGRETHLSGTDLTTLLKSMSADQVSKVQLMDIPPAKYSASGNAGLINIQLKKNLKSGFTGRLNVGYGQGRYDRENAGINLNYRSDKMTLFGNYNYSRSNDWNLWHAELYYYSDDSYKYLTGMLDEYHTYWKTRAHSNQFTAGMTYNLNKNNVVTLQSGGTLPVVSFHSDKHVIMKNGELQPTSSYHALTSNPYSGTDITYALSWHGTLDTAGSQLSAEVDYAPFVSREASYYITQNYDSLGNPAEQIDQRQPLPADITIKSLQMDYTKNYKKQMASLSAGWKVSEVKTENKSHLYNKINGDWKLDPHYSDHFIYNEQVNAAYLSYKRMVKSFSFQAGLRVEQTITKSDQIEIDSVLKRNYAQLFPTVFLQKKLDKNSSLSLSYGRRISRPIYSQLNPFHSFGDPHQYNEGNPYLKPQLSNNFQISYSFKNWLNTSLSYNHIHDLQVITEKVLPGEVSIAGFDNIDTKNYYALSTNLSLHPFNWWYVSLFLNLYHDQIKGVYVGENINTDYTIFQGYVDNEFILPKNFSIELTGVYNTKSVYGVFILSPFGYIDAGIKKAFGKGRTSLSLRVNDLFKTYDLEMYHKANGTKHYSHVYPFYGAEARRVQLGFEWKFGNQKVKTKKHTLGIENEINRVKH